MTPRVAFILAGLVAMLAGSPVGQAGSDRTLALMSLDIAGDDSQPLRENVASAIGAAIRNTGHAFVDLDQVARIVASDPDLAGCLTTECIDRLSQAAGASELLRVHIAANGNSYEIDIELLAAGAEGGLAGRLQESCSVCTVEELAVVAGAATSKLLLNRDSGTVPVEITCDPPGAEIYAGDVLLGTAPYRGALPAGRHRLVAKLDGYTSAFKVVDLDPAISPHAFELTLTPTGILDSDSNSRPFKVWKWAAAGGAAASLVAGAVLMSMDGDQSCDAQGGSCPMVYDTRGAGFGSLAVGLLAGGASAWMFVKDRRGTSTAR